MPMLASIRIRHLCSRNGPDPRQARGPRDHPLRIDRGSPELVKNVKESIVATVMKTLRESNKVLKHENVLRKQENLNTWNQATQTFDSVIDRVITNTTEIKILKRKIDELYAKGARFMLRRRRDPHTCALTACCPVLRSRCRVRARWRWRQTRA